MPVNRSVKSVVKLEAENRKLKRLLEQCRKLAELHYYARNWGDNPFSEYGQFKIKDGG